VDGEWRSLYRTICYKGYQEGNGSEFISINCSLGEMNELMYLDFSVFWLIVFASLFFYMS